ncbi:uncharacterized protein LOC130776982 isoform X3 [Actinidia eriantha]|uniref:uncharacterized protein LOC130776982 isoform X3 n=1 Tax=Actinidia eriantha TaxID=165200 RepID=UPI00258BB8B9|nr:uncharacterized protein LOC130776982 isoform X3 [Actinidia eriantha]XP_057491244.1 uncharacterized protein LOC130776982 isoform X3 [Actinidia eriantha]
MARSSKGQMNDASEVLEVIFGCLHQSDRMWRGSCNCTAHAVFGMDVVVKMICYNCGIESRQMKYNTLFYDLNADALRRMAIYTNPLRILKIRHAGAPFDELCKLGRNFNCDSICDLEVGGCGRTNTFQNILSSHPHMFTLVLGWETVFESVDDIRDTMEALTTEIDIGVMFEGLDPGHKHSLVSMVCYHGQHYVCFAYNHQHQKWILYNDETMKDIGSWKDVTSECERGRLQPQVLFFEAQKCWLEVLSGI